MQREVIGDCTLYCGDALELMSDLQGEALITDPPYGINFDCRYRRVHRRQGSLRCPPDEGDHWTEKVRGDDRPFNPLPWLHFAQIILWGGHLCAAHLPAASKWLIWDKREGLASDNHGDAELAWTNLPGVIRVHRQLWRGLVRRGEENVVWGPKVHPMQKPVALMRWCVEQTSGVVCDPFMGSGTTGVACAQLGRSFLGVEIHAGYFDLACRRIEAAYAQPRLPFPDQHRPMQPMLIEV